MNTRNIGEVVPACMKAFSKASPGIVGELLHQGFQHCLYFRLAGEESPTIGTWECEWRLHGVWAFFAERFELSELEAHLSKIEEIPVLIGQKAYTRMVGLGLSAQFARLNQKKLVELLSVFERSPHRWSDTDKEEFRLLRHSMVVRLSRKI